MEEKLTLTQEWDKTFPKSEKVDHRKVTFHNRYGITLAADLYAPKGVPPLSPVKDGSKAMVRNPRSAMVWAYSPAACSFTAPKGPQTAMAGSFPDTPLGAYRSAAKVMP